MIFDELSPKELRRVEQYGEMRSFQKNAFIIQEGMSGRNFYFILSGKVEIRKRISDLKYRKLAELGMGDLFGEIGFFGVARRSASVVAIQDCEIMEFSGERFEDVLAGEPKLGVKVYRGMARELAQRLAKNDEALASAILWTLERSDGLFSSYQGGRDQEADPAAPAG